MSRPAQGLRLLALPLAQRRTAAAPDLIYFHPVYPPRSTRAPSDSDPQPSLPQRAINKASSVWEGFGKAEGGWKRKLYTYGERAMDRIAFEEWALKSLDPSLAPKPWSMTAAAVAASNDGTVPADSDSASALAAEKPPDNQLDSPPRQGTVPLLFPSSLIEQKALAAHLRTQVEDRQAYHHKWLIYDLIGIPLTAPFAIVPVIPNIPFFFLAWRAYSHWKARNASRYLVSLIESGQLLYEPSKTLDTLYTSSSAPTDDAGLAGRILLVDEQVDTLADKFGLPDQAKIDVRRAIVQVRARLREDTEAPQTRAATREDGPTAEKVKAEQGDESSPRSK